MAIISEIHTLGSLYIAFCTDIKSILLKYFHKHCSAIGMIIDRSFLGISKFY